MIEECERGKEKGAVVYPLGQEKRRMERARRQKKDGRWREMNK